MGNYYSPEGNYEVWEEKPDGYFTIEEWQKLHPPEPQEPPTIEQLIAQYTIAIQRRLDEFARTRGYDNIFTAATYAASSDADFQEEGRYCVDARDATWRKAFEILTAVQSGERPMMTIDEVMAELPALEWTNENVRVT